MRWVVALLLLSLVPSSASAAGFAVGEQGAASLGVAGAATARDDLPETGFYNAAATRAGFIAAAGAAGIAPSLRHTDPSSGEVTKSKPHLSTPPYLHVGWVGQAGKHRVGGLVSGFVPFGAALAWPDDWAGRFEVRTIELQVFEAAASAVYGVALSDAVEVGASGTFRAQRATVELARNLDVVSHEPRVQLGGDANAFGGAAALWARFGTVKAGVTLRSATRLDFEGAAHFEDVPPELSGAAHDQRVTTSITLPERIATGVAWDPGFGVASLDAVVFRWSRFETFGVDFEDDETPDIAEPRNWHDTVTVRAGYEHRFLNRALGVRGGVAFDPTPSPTDTLSPTLPDASRVLVSLGVGYAFAFGLRADLALSHVALLGATATGEHAMPGRYGGSAQIVSVGVGFQR